MADLLDTGNYDEEQKRLMAEEVILLDREDKVIGSASKKDSHMVSKGLMLHRAFSVFLFNSEGKLLLQQRADEKITFPGFWTNTCCSHPLHREAELEDDGNAIGVKRAAVRKLFHELGIPEGDVPEDSLHWLTRLHYKAESECGMWGEHEIDYIFITQIDLPTLAPVANEIKDTMYVSKDELVAMLDAADSEGTYKITPWFRLIVDNFLIPVWWDALADLSSVEDRDTIHRLGPGV